MFHPLTQNHFSVFVGKETLPGLQHFFELEFEYFFSFYIMGTQGIYI